MITDGTNTITLLNSYLPCGLDRLPYDDPKWQLSLEHIRLASEKIARDSIVIWGGDFNYTSRDQDRRFGGDHGRKNPGACERAEDFERFFTDHVRIRDVTCTSSLTRVGHPTSSPNQGGARLDRFYASLSSRVVSTECFDWRVPYRTDHKAVVVEILLPKKNGSTASLNIKGARADETQLYLRSIDSWFEANPGSSMKQGLDSTTSIAHHCFRKVVRGRKYVSRDISKAARELKSLKIAYKLLSLWRQVCPADALPDAVITRRQQQSLRHRRNNAVQRLVRLGLGHLRDNPPGVKAEIAKAKRSLARLVNAEKLKVESLRDRYAALSLHNKAHVHRLLNRSSRAAVVSGFGGVHGEEARALALIELQSLFGSSSDNDTGIGSLQEALDAGSLHLSSSLSSQALVNVWERARAPLDIEPSIWNPVLADIEEDDVKWYIQNLDQDGAAGMDELSPALLKMIWEGCEHFRKWFLKTANATLGGDREECEALVTFIPKHGKTQAEPGSARPITLLPILRRSISSIVNRRIGKVIDEHPSPLLQQGTCGFLPSLGCDVAVERLLNAAEVWAKDKAPVFAIQSDIQKAFDTVGWNILEEGIDRLRMPAALKRFMLATVGSVRSVRARVDGAFTDRVVRSRGTPQGSPLSPLCFAIAADIIMKAIRSVLSCAQGDLAFVYADDSVVVCRSHTSFEKVVDVLNSASFVTGLAFSAKKTEIRGRRCGDLTSIRLGEEEVKVQPLRKPLNILGVPVALNGNDSAYVPLARRSWMSTLGNLHFVHMRCIHSLQLAALYVREVVVPRLEYRLRHLKGNAHGTVGIMKKISKRIAAKVSQIAECRQLSAASLHVLLDIPDAYEMATLGQASMVIRQCNAHPLDPLSRDTREELCSGEESRYGSLHKNLGKLGLQLKVARLWKGSLNNRTFIFSDSLIRSIRVDGGGGPVAPGQDVTILMVQSQRHFRFTVQVGENVTHAAKYQWFAKESRLGNFIACLSSILVSAFASGVRRNASTSVCVRTGPDLKFEERLANFYSLSKSKRLRTNEALWFTLLERVVSDLRIKLSVEALSVVESFCLSDVLERTSNLEPIRLVLDFPEEYILPVQLVKTDCSPLECLVVTGDHRRFIRQKMRASALCRMQGGLHQGFFALSGDIRFVMKTAMNHSGSLARFALGALSNCLRIRDFPSREFLSLGDDGDRFEYEPDSDDSEADCDWVAESVRIACPICHSNGKWFHDSVEHIFLHCPAHERRRNENYQALVDFVVSRHNEFGREPHPSEDEVKRLLRFGNGSQLFPSANSLAAMFGVLPSTEFSSVFKQWFSGLSLARRDEGSTSVAQLKTEFVEIALTGALKLWRDHQRFYSAFPLVP